MPLMHREAECERATLVRGRHNQAAPPLSPLLQTGVYTGARPPVRADPPVFNGKVKQTDEATPTWRQSADGDNL